MKKKAHKTRKQRQAEKVAAASRLVEQANAVINPLEPVTKFHPLKDGSTVELSCSRVTNLSSDTINWIFDLMERNQKTMYEQSNWGWNETKKQTELTEDAAWYLIASYGEKMIGFSHFRFDLDNSIEVLYCYELQLEPSETRKGIGRIMMQSLQAIAARNQMQKVVLTVFKHNPMALSFFYKLGYKVDVTNPPPSDVDYVILSKQNLRE